MNDRRGLAFIVIGLLLISLTTSAVPASAETIQVATEVDPSETYQFERVGGIEDTDGSLESTDDENHLIQTLSFSNRDTSRGVVTLEMGYQIPDQVTEFETAIPDNGEVSATRGFESAGDGNYSWDEETVTPSITLSLDVNRTGTYYQRPDTRSSAEGYMFADTGDWAIVSAPSTSVWWKSYQNEPAVTFVRETAVDGEGVAGDQMVFLGPYISETRLIDGQTITIVVPEAATLDPSREAIFASLNAATPHLPESPVNRSLMIAAPTSVDWGPYGLASGSDTWVEADQPLDTPENVWLHEFVHLRQDFQTTNETLWIREGMPEFYAAFLTLEQGRIDYQDFQDHLDRGTDGQYEDTVLSRPDSWIELANYAKGALVYGTLDRRIRTDSDGAYSAIHIFESMNDREQPISQDFLYETIETHASTDTASDFHEDTTTTNTPATWTYETHQEVFDFEPPNIVTRIEEPIAISGPYRNLTNDSILPLVVGEELSVPVQVENTGEMSGTYDLQFMVAGSPVANATGSLAGGERETVRFDHTVNRTGNVTIAVDGHNWLVSIEEPAIPVVSNLAVSEDTVDVGESITLSVHLSNPDVRPADGRITPTLDGEPLTTWDVRLDVNESVERELQVELTKSGTHQLVVGSHTIKLSAVGPTSTTTQSDTEPVTVESTSNPARTEAESVTATEPTTATQSPGMTGIGMFVGFLLVTGWVRMRNP